MLIQTDINEIGDKLLNPEEAVHRETEALLRMAASRKIGGQDELEDAERSAGPRMAWQEVIRRLRMCDPSLFFADSQGGGHIAVYRPMTERERAEHIYDADKREWWNDHVYVTGFPKEPLAEFSHVILDSSNLPTREIRGWRSVLMALIKARAITYKSTVKHFGEAIGFRTGRWYAEIRDYK